MILYAAAGATGLAIGHVAFPRFLRAFIRYQYGRMLKEDDLYSDPVEPLDMDPRDVPPPAFEVPPQPAVGTHARLVHDFGPPRGTDVFPDPGPGEPQSMFSAYEKVTKWQQSAEVEAIYELGSKDPVAFIRVSDGARIEQMVCPDCYLGYDYQIVAKHHEPGSIPDQIPEDAPKCKHCNGKGRISVTRL